MLLQLSHVPEAVVEREHLVRFIYTVFSLHKMTKKFGYMIQ